MFLKLFSRFKKQGFIEPVVHSTVEKKVYLVYGDSYYGGVILEVTASSVAEALDIARELRSDCRFNHVNIK